MKYDLTFTNASDQRGMLAVHGPRCVAEWHAAKVLRQRVARAGFKGAELMNNAEMMNYLRHRMEQAEASVATFVANNDAREVLALLERYTKMNQSTAPRKVLNGTMASYGLMRGIMAHIENGGWAHETDGGTENQP